MSDVVHRILRDLVAARKRMLDMMAHAMSQGGATQMEYEQANIEYLQVQLELARYEEKGSTND